MLTNEDDAERLRSLVSVINALRETDPQSARAIELDLSRASLVDLNASSASQDEPEWDYIQCLKAAFRGIVRGRFVECEMPRILPPWLLRHGDNEVN